MSLAVPVTGSQETKSLARIEQRPFFGRAITTMDDVSTIYRLAKLWVESGLLPKRYSSPQKVLTVAMMADELGLPRLAAMRRMYVIDATPILDTKGLLGICQASGELDDWSITEEWGAGDEEKFATCMMRRSGKTPMQVTFTMGDAKRAGLAGKENWTKWPKNMLRARAISFCANLVFADRCNGILTPDEAGLPVVVDPSGDVVLDAGDAKVREAIDAGVPETEAPPEPQPEPKPEPSTEDQAATIMQLMATVYPDDCGPKSKLSVLRPTEKKDISTRTLARRERDLWADEIDGMEALIAERIEDARRTVASGSTSAARPGELPMGGAR